MARSFNCTDGYCGALDCETCRGKGAANDYWAAELAREEAAALEFHTTNENTDDLPHAQNPR